MSDQEQRKGGFFVVRGGMAVDVTEQVNSMLDSMWPNGGRGYDPTRLARQRCFALYRKAKTALSPNRGPTFGPVDIRMPAVAREGDEIDM